MSLHAIIIHHTSPVKGEREGGREGGRKGGRERGREGEWVERKGDQEGNASYFNLSPLSFQFFLILFLLLVD